MWMWYIYGYCVVKWRVIYLTHHSSILNFHFRRAFRSCLRAVAFPFFFPSQFRLDCHFSCFFFFFSLSFQLKLGECMEDMCEIGRTADSVQTRKFISVENREKKWILSENKLLRMDGIEKMQKTNTNFRPTITVCRGSKEQLAEVILI